MLEKETLQNLGTYRVNNNSKKKKGFRTEKQHCVCVCVIGSNYKRWLTDVKDEGVTESVVSVVTSMDQKLCVWEHSAAMPAETQTPIKRKITANESP